MPLNDIFTVNITTSSPGLTALGFGKPMILGAYTKTWSELYREYASISEVAVDFLATDPEYRMAARLFQQDPRPPTVGVGRGALPPTQRWAITPTVLNATAYKLYVGDKTVTYTSDSTATAAEIIGGLLALINALAPAWAANHAYSVADRCSSGGLVYECITAGTSNNSSPAVPPSGTTSNITDGTAHWKYVGAAVTASDQTTYLRIVVQTAGLWTSVEVDNVTRLSLAQDHADPGVATDLAAIKLEDDSWYELLTLSNSYAVVLAAAGWVETDGGKTYAAQTQDTAVEATALAGATDIGEKLQSLGYARTHLWYDRDGADFLDAGVSGACLPLDPGTETWKFKQPAGCAALSLTSTQKSHLDAKNVNYFYVVTQSLAITGEGKVASGEWIDIVRGRDALANAIQTAVVNAVTDPAISKLPYTDAGIQVIANRVQEALTKFEVSPGLLTPGSSTISVPKASSVSDADRAARVLNNLSWTAQLQSAIHSGTISGVVTY